jgi:orotate phosphoribosyltransferase-like protein
MVSSEVVVKEMSTSLEGLVGIAQSGVPVATS